MRVLKVYYDNDGVVTYDDYDINTDQNGQTEKKSNVTIFSSQAEDILNHFPENKIQSVVRRDEDIIVDCGRVKMFIEDYGKMQNDDRVESFIKMINSKMSKEDKNHFALNQAYSYSKNTIDVDYIHDILTYNEYAIGTNSSGLQTTKHVKRGSSDEVGKYLNQLPIEEIQGVTDVGADMIVSMASCDVVLHNIDKLRNEKILTPFINNVMVKSKADSEDIETAVTRENKYSGWKVLGAGIGIGLAILLTAGAIKIANGSHEIDTEEPTYTTYSWDNGSVQVIPPVTTTIVDNETNPTIPFITEEIITTLPNIEDKPDINLQHDDVYIEYEDRSGFEKLNKTRELYYDTISKYANMYGLDPNLVLALATQERGIHSDKEDKSGALGLMQIQTRVWVGHDIKAYNFETCSVETVRITKDKLKDCDSNIKIGCMILRSYMEMYNYNIILALQGGYNMGLGNMNKILNECANATGQSVEDLKSDPSNTSWFVFRDSKTEDDKYKYPGDHKYIEHIFSYMGNEFETFVYNREGNKIELHVKNNEKVKSLS